MGLVKSSVCLLLMKIFPQRRLMAISWGLIALTACWSLMTILIGFLICQPISKMWDEAVPGSCGNENYAFAAVSAVDIFVDLLIIFLPIPHILRLHMAIANKIALAVVFLLGLV